ncbi:hypothetical protein FB45DRAFT_918262 [Roridomyces roridus]|uniref:Fungal-type protein kinase domain-containing protein n=1 Tax=Roridomyces roridus TaxID=1738132 RepID=A0AAD7BQZ0_9AGAR|nr:hypothetical protein FB45DRAFT_918262 [Roridomyces roridus]
MDPALVGEIDKSHLRQVPDLLPTLLPDHCLPLSPSEILEGLSTGGMPLYVGDQWVGCPNLSKPSNNGDVERALCVFFQTFGERVAAVVHEKGKTLPDLKHEWTARYAERGVQDAPNVRKPDILFAKAGEEETTWSHVRIHGELKSKSSDSALKQLLNGAYFIFSSQDERRFVVSLSFTANNLQLYICDRAGLVTTAPFDIHKDPESFVRVLAGLMFTNDSAFLGYDTSIVTKPAGRFITVEGCEYALVKLLFISDVIRGRGTVCWHARHGGEDFVIKDTWADDSREFPEASILRRAKDIEGVPQVVADVVLRVNDRVDSTAHLRSTIMSSVGPKSAKNRERLSDIETRTHRRLVITPFALSLSHFASQRELISIFIDVVKAHRDLYKKAQILHRDISSNNLMLVPPPGTWNSVDLPPTSPSLAALAGSHTLPKDRVPQPEAAPALVPQSDLRRGLLIDVDYALVIKPDEGARKPAVGHRTGTLPFMAIDVLYFGGDLPTHEPKHDLESMLYVLIWMCVNYAGPKNVERKNFDIHDSKLSGWVKAGDYESNGFAKTATMSRPTFWELSVLASFAPYFAPLKDCVSKWKDLYCQNKMDYEHVLAVLEDTLKTLPEKETWSRKDDPEGYGPQDAGKKRKRADFVGQINDEQEERAAKFLSGEDGRRAPNPASGEGVDESSSDDDSGDIDGGDFGVAASEERRRIPASEPIPFLLTAQRQAPLRTYATRRRTMASGDD